MLFESILECDLGGKSEVSRTISDVNSMSGWLYESMVLSLGVVQTQLLILVPRPVMIPLSPCSDPVPGRIGSAGTSSSEDHPRQV